MTEQSTGTMEKNRVSPEPVKTVSQARMQALVLLCVGVAVGFAAGVFVGKGIAKPTPPTMDTGSPAAGMAPGGAMPGGAMPGGQQGMGAQKMSPEQKAQFDSMQKEAEVLEAAVKAKPGDLASLVKLGNTYHDMRDYKKAIVYYEQAAKLDPSNLDVRTDLYTSYWYIQEVDKAAEGLQAVLKDNPKHPQALNNMGIVLLHGKNDMEGARQCWLTLIGTGTTAVDIDRVKKMLEAIDRMLAEQKAAGTKTPPTPGSK